MVRTLEVDQRWGMTCTGYHIQAYPDRSSTQRLLALQQDIAHASPVALHLIPQDALHLSVMTFVPAQPPSDVAERHWIEIKDAITIDSTLCRPNERLTVTFTTMKYTERALIVATRDQPNYLLDIRRRCGEVLSSLGLAQPRYDQAHLTIARYAERALLGGIDIQDSQTG